MRNLDPIEQRICDNIESHKDEIIAIGRDIYYHAEPGWFEHRTAGVMSDVFKKMGMYTVENIATTGIKGYLKPPGQTGPTVALMGELDAVIYEGHPDANPENGAAHICGHHGQIAAVLGAALGLNDPEVMAALDGNVVFLGVPCEEGASPDIISKLVSEGKIQFPSGKSELIRIGAFDDIDITLGHHLLPEQRIVRHNGTNNGCVTKLVTFHGKACHGASPFLGVDAMSAMSIAMHALDAQRETFREADGVRIHGFIVENGKAANVVAERVVLNYIVRAASNEALQDASAKFDRAMRAGAVAMGCGLTIQTDCKTMNNLSYTLDQCRCIDETLAQIDEYPTAHLPATNHRYGSNDFGDVQHIMPAMRFTTGGVKNDLHTKDMQMEDEYLAYVMAAKVFALSAYKLLKNKAEYAKVVIDTWNPEMTKESYTAFCQNLSTTEEMPMQPLPTLAKSIIG